MKGPDICERLASHHCQRNEKKFELEFDSNSGYVSFFFFAAVYVPLILLFRQIFLYQKPLIT